MNVFHPAVFQQEARFHCPRFKTLHYVAVFFSDGTIDYFDGENLSPRRDDAYEYEDLSEAECDCAILEARDFNASVETFQRYFQ